MVKAEIFELEDYYGRQRVQRVERLTIQMMSQYSHDTLNEYHGRNDFVARVCLKLVHELVLQAAKCRTALSC
jgi:hypothetical protein